MYNNREKKTIAFHEAGHATVSWFLEHAAPLVKVTIVPRGQSLGAAWYLPEERQIVKPEQILDEMCAALGGRAAEKVGRHGQCNQRACRTTYGVQNGNGEGRSRAKNRGHHPVQSTRQDEEEEGQNNQQQCIVFVCCRSRQ